MIGNDLSHNKYMNDAKQRVIVISVSWNITSRQARPDLGRDETKRDVRD